MITVAELYEALERDYIINCRKSRRNITSVLENHLRAAFGQLPAAGVPSDKIAEYIVARQKQGAKNATINRETSCLQRLYTLAVQAGKLTRSPHIFHLAERNVRQGFLISSRRPGPGDSENRRLVVWNLSGRVYIWLEKNRITSSSRAPVRLYRAQHHARRRHH